MELRQLRYFLAIADELSFSRGADRLGVSQSALSTQISKLEDELGALLFTRAPRSIALTSTGAVILTHAREAVSHADKALQFGRSAATGTIGALALGYHRALPWSLTGRLVSAFMKTRPDVSLNFIEQSSSAQLDLIFRGKIDAGLLVSSSSESLLPRSLQYEIETKRVDRQPLFIACGSGHRLAKASEVSIRDLRHEPFVMCGPAFSIELNQLIIGACEKVGFTPQIRFQADQMKLLWGLIACGDGISFAYRSSALTKRPGVVFLPIADLEEQADFILAWKTLNSNPLLHNFIESASTVSISSG